MKHVRLTLILPLALFSFACGDSSGTTSDSAGTMSTSTTTGPTTTGMTATGSGTTTTTGPTGSGTETAGGTPCADFCLNQVQCDPELQNYGDCLADCTEINDLYEEHIGGGCVAAVNAVYNCLAEATCEELENETACEAELLAYADACAPDECDAMCTAVEMCDPSIEDCVLECIGIFVEFQAEFGDVCGDSYLAWAQCLGGLDCPDLTLCLDFDPGCSCQAEADALENCDA